MWSRAGDELFFFGLDVSRETPVQGLLSVSIAADPELSVGSPTLVAAVRVPGVEPLDDVDYLDGVPLTGSNWGVGYDVEPGGDRFIMIRPVSEPTPNDELMIVFNWHRELLERVPIP